MKYRFDKTPLAGEISDFTGGIRLHKVDETKWEPFWDQLVREYHYLGYESVIGGRIKYIITLGERIVGAISYCSAAYQLGPRDEFIGWDDETRRKMLQHLVCNNRFLILPWIQIRNLASRVLALSLKQLRKDWEKQYEISPVMAETFVDAQYKGTCYRASNWTYLGITKGYGRIGNTFVYHGQKKDIYVYIIDRQFARNFKPDIRRVNTKIDEEKFTAMINGIPMWSPSLLKVVGISGNPIEQLKQKFADHMIRFIKYLGRKEHWQHLITMAQGFLSDLNRKSIEPIAIAFEGIDSVRNVTNFMSKSKWDDSGMLTEYQTDLSETLATEEAMITGDETGIPKKGNKSVGVARQYCGSTGKVDNCQVGVMLGYASSKGYGIIDYNLYMPEKWFDNNHAEQRKKSKVPSAIKFKTKNEILSEMVRNAVDSGKFPAKYVGVDSAYGSDGDFLDMLPKNIIYFADVKSSSRLFTERPPVSVPPYSGKGRKPEKEKPEFEPLTVKEIIENPATIWNKVTLGIGAKGPIIAEDTVLRVIEVRNGLPGRDVWLYARKMEDGTTKYALCNAPADAMIVEIRKPALMRWSIEQCFKECKDYLGMDHYESRSWDAWRRHMLIIFISHLFITKLRIAFSSVPRSPCATPHTDTPVNLDDYLEAYEQMKDNQPITHPDIKTMPTKPQQFLTIGLVMKLLSTVFVKIGFVIDEIDYALYKAMSAFASHSLATINSAILAKQVGG
jgi:SRSO17 transposase